MSFSPTATAVATTNNNNASLPQSLTGNEGGNNKARKFQTRRKFTSDEDETIRALVAAHGEYNWELVATFIPGRTPRQCRDRYRNNLKPGFICSQWTCEEDEMLYMKHNEHGSKWTLISKFFPGRSPATIKNRWNYYVSKMHFLDKSTSKNLSGYGYLQYSSESEDPTLSSSSACYDENKNSTSADDSVDNTFTATTNKPMLQTGESHTLLLALQAQLPQRQFEQLQQQRRIIEIDDKYIENKDIENKDIENKDIENKDIENKDIENRNKMIDSNIEDIDSLFSDKDIEYMFENDFDLISSI